MVKKSKRLEEADEDYCPRRKNKYYKAKKRNIGSVQIQTTNSNKWTSQENNKFLIFIKNHKEMLLCPHQRKQQKIFLLLSRFVETRSPDQCRSHHQKMIKHHNDLDGIIENLQTRLASRSLVTLNCEKVEKAEPSNFCVEMNLEKNENIVQEDEICPESSQPQQKSLDIWQLVNQDIWLNENPPDQISQMQFCNFN